MQVPSPQQKWPGWGTVRCRSSSLEPEVSRHLIDHMCYKYDTPIAAICRLLEVPGVQAQGQLRGVGEGQQGAVISEHDLPSDMVTARVSG